jgi:hypothetical protein
MFDAACALAESTGEPLSLALHGAGAAEALRSWATARGLALHCEEIRSDNAAPWTRLFVLLGTASSVEVYADTRETPPAVRAGKRPTTRS